jgi:F420-0:gamma-glutamyl ligase
MGQAGEARPLVLVRGLEFPSEPAAAQYLLRPAGEDLFL